MGGLDNADRGGAAGEVSVTDEEADRGTIAGRFRSLRMTQRRSSTTPIATPTNASTATITFQKATMRATTSRTARVMLPALFPRELRRVPLRRRLLPERLTDRLNDALAAPSSDDAG